MADNVAHDASITALRAAVPYTFPPQRIGAKSADSLPTAVTADGEAVDLVATRQGQLRAVVDSIATGVSVVISALPSATTGSTHSIDVTDQSVTALTSLSTRKGWFITNNGFAPCYVVLGATAVSGEVSAANGGHYLGTVGESTSMATMGGYNGTVSLICKNGESTVCAVSSW